jgi:glycosyltransferase involved in cell wall biosynthesis/SAM-dependent methyltransferase
VRIKNYVDSVLSKPHIAETQCRHSNNEPNVEIELIWKELSGLVEDLNSINIENKVNISVVIATKDRYQYLLRALRSVIKQSQRPFEIVIINNGTKFNVRELAFIQDLCHEVPKIQILWEPDLLDISSCRQKGLNLSTSDIITYLDDDNIMWPTWLAEGSEYLKNQKIEFIYGRQLNDKSISVPFQREFDRIRILQHNFIDTNTIMHVKNVGRWTPKVTRLADWNFILNYIQDFPENPIVPIKAISSIYKTDAPNRITSPLYSPFNFLVRLLHDLIPDSSRIRRGRFQFCTICLGASEFSNGGNGRKRSVCPKCGSLERHRTLQIINEVIFAHMAEKDVKGEILEVAPSNCSAKIFKDTARNYRSFDSDPSADSRKCDFVADICAIPVADKSVSLFVALHVLEHVINDQMAMQEISRVLAPGGVCLLQVPLAEYPQFTEESFIEDDELRIERYGQVDHVRIYGEDILDRLIFNGLNCFFISAEDILPDPLLKIFSLNDGFKFIVCTSDKDPEGRKNLGKIRQNLIQEHFKLEIFSELLEINSK